MRSIYDNVVADGFIIQFNTTGAVSATGPAVDTKGYTSAVLRVYTNTVGAGLAVNTGASLAAVVQESADGSTGWTNALDNTGAAIGVTQVATTSVVIGSARIEGLGLNTARYLRVVTTGNFGGAASVLRQFTSCAVIELGRGYRRPPTTTVSNT